jgi:uncharacterized protein YecE (DUF72 family)
MVRPRTAKQAQEPDAAPAESADTPAPRDDTSAPRAANDPGVEVARARAAALDTSRTTQGLRIGNARVLIGTAGWTDPTLTAPGVFYPPKTSSAEDRLRYYASRFGMVEVDSPYYALPTASMAELWVQRTPSDFRFDVKAHALMTGHPTEVARLPKVLREALPADIAAKKRVYPKDLPGPVYDAVWGAFVDAMRPLHAAGKLGAVLLQFPRWFVPSVESKDAILEAKARLEGLPCAIEFRNGSWFSSRLAERTLQLLSDHALPFVMVDEPQGLQSSVPPIVAVTSPRLAILRLHGRRGDMWERPGATVAEKYRYLYDGDELADWAPPVREIAAQASEVHVVFNNCYGNYGTTNAAELGAMLAD